MSGVDLHLLAHGLLNSPSLVSAGGATLAPHCVWCSAGVRIDGNVYYVLKDRLGSAYATTDALGNVVGEMRYYAFGETRLSTGTMFTDRLFTGQRYIRCPEPVEGAELGIYHFNARFYSPKLGRFLSADTLMSGFANPQGLNRFSYVANNPVRYTDPTGHMICAFCDGGGDFPDSTPPTDEPEPGDGGGGSDGEDLDVTVNVPDDSPCGGHLDCNQSPEDYVYSQIPFSSADACEAFHLDPWMCNPEDWPSIPGGSGVDLHIDALGIRIEGSGWLFGGADLNIDLLYFGTSNEIGLFLAPGGQSGEGGGAAITGGILIAQNVSGREAYAGASYSTGGDIPIIPLGINLEGEVSIGTPNADRTLPTTVYIGGGPLQPEAGAYSGANIAVPITGFWDWITGK